MSTSLEILNYASKKILSTLMHTHSRNTFRIYLWDISNITCDVSEIFLRPTETSLWLCPSKMISEMFHYTSQESLRSVSVDIRDASKTSQNWLRGLHSWPDYIITINFWWTMTFCDKELHIECRDFNNHNFKIAQKKIGMQGVDGIFYNLVNVSRLPFWDGS
jgi:hypothetical protein